MATVTLTELKAFPTAEGWARGERTFASSPSIRKVTNLNDSGTGSLRTACETAGNAIIIFEVAGNITLDSPITLSSGKYIAGQTAFRNNGQGITLRQSASFTSATAPITANSNSVIRFLRIRNKSGASSLNDSYLTKFPEGGSSIIIDHCSFSYAPDEVIDFTGTQTTSFQYNIVCEGVDTSSGFSKGHIIGGSANQVSIYRNLYSNNHQRNPLIGGDSNTGDEFELVNNYVFNCGNFGINLKNNNSGAPILANIIGNRIHRGNGSTGSQYLITVKPESGYSVYLRDNKDDLFRTSDAQAEITVAGRSNTGSANTVQLDATYVTGTEYNYPLTSNNSDVFDVDNLRTSLLPKVGAYLYRDSIDQRQIDQIDADTGLSNFLTTPNEYPTLADMDSVPTDSNADGIPDGWVSSYTIVNTAGYSALELYLAEIAGDLDDLAVESAIEITSKLIRGSSGSDSSTKSYLGSVLVS